jgi:hypothetical protein
MLTKYATIAPRIIPGVLQQWTANAGPILLAATKQQTRHHCRATTATAATNRRQLAAGLSAQLLQ